MPDPEPWLRGAMEGVPPFVMPLFFSFQQVREDLSRATSGLTDAQTWADVDGASLGFHLKHIAGSVDRLTTYLFEGELSAQQLAALGQEHSSDVSLDTLLRAIDETLKRTETRLVALDPALMFAPLTIGRKKLPTTVLGLMVHIAEHTQRHLGQAITIAKAIRRRQQD